MAKRWKKEDQTYLKRYGKSRTLAELAKRFRTDEGSVASKLKELGLTAKDSADAGPDPLLDDFAQGVRAAQEKKYKDAVKHLEKVIAESDTPQLVDRARQYLAAAEVRRGGHGGQSDDGGDPYLAAVVEKNRGNFEEALAICSAGGRQSKDERFAYLAASIHALREEADPALKFLSLAVDMNASNRIHAHYDPDFVSLRDSEEFKRLLA
ncbi:MAG TPA: hypothetical protein VKA53_07715 [Thermoanaerobaculia bacterium]|nr:hypothetical protein [Thermoanaerobaculia bacterium]